MNKADEYSIQKQMTRALESVSVRLWGRWLGKDTRVRFRCNKHSRHDFEDTVVSVAERERNYGTGCPYCVELEAPHTVDFETFKKDAVAVNAVLAAYEKKRVRHTARYNGSAGVDRYHL